MSNQAQARRPLEGCDFTGADIRGLNINGKPATFAMINEMGGKVSGMDLASERAAAEGRNFAQGTGIQAETTQATSPVDFAQAATALRNSGISDARETNLTSALAAGSQPDLPNLRAATLDKDSSTMGMA